MSNTHKTGVEDIYPLSPLQQGLFFQQILAPENRSYWNQVRMRLTGELDIAAFRVAWQHTVSRHAALRTRFVRDRKGRMLQVVDSDVTLPWHHEDLTCLDSAEREARISNYDGGEARPLDRPPLINLAVFDLGPKDHVVIWGYQHIILDGWSERIIWNDVCTAYRQTLSGEALDHSAAARYSAYISWLKNRDKEPAKRFWADYLADLRLPRVPRTPSASEVDYADFSFRLSSELSERAVETARLHRLTLTTVLQGCWALVLGAERRASDIAIGSAINDRPADLPGSDAIAGLMMASVPMRYRTDSTEAIVEWLRATQNFASAMSGHSGLTLGEIKSAAGIAAAADLFDTLCALDADPGRSPLKGRQGPIEVVEVEHRGITEFPLSLTFLPGRAIELNFTVDTTIYSADWCARARDDFAAVLEMICSAPHMPVADIAEAASQLVSGRGSTGATEETGHPQGLDYWRSKLDGTLPALEFPRFRPRPPEQEMDKQSVSLRFDKGLCNSLRQFSTAKSCDLSDVILTGFTAALLRYCRQSEVVIGTLQSITDPSYADEDSAFQDTNCVALRLQPSAEWSFSCFLDDVAEIRQEARAHADIKFEDVVAALPAPLDSSRAAVFQVLFADDRCRDTEGMNDRVDTAIAHSDLSCWINESGTGIDIEIEYANALFEAITVDHFAYQLRHYLAAAVADPEQAWLRIPLLDEKDETTLLARQGVRATAMLGQSVLELVGPVVEKHATRVAVSTAAAELSYAELYTRYSVVARNLAARGVVPGAIVGLAMSRTERLPLAMLAILQAGAAFLPLDVEQPVERLRFVLNDSGARLIITDTMIESSLKDFDGRILHLDELEEPDSGAVDSPARIPESGLAYVMYTSGSTGTPKGVAVGHRELTNLLTAFQEPLAISSSDVWAAITTTSFDISVMELLLPLTVGARVHVVGESVVIDGRELSAELEKSGATIMQATPATWRLLFDSGWSGDPSLAVLCGGEPLPLDLAQKLGDSCGKVWNVYGPTETTIWSTSAVVEPQPTLISIGKPIQNTSIYIVDEYDALVPDGVEGEILIAGEGVAQGYLNNPELTENRFGIDPFNDQQRVYRTGDMGRWLPNAELEHRGRSDSQLKLRGFRIEAGDVENNLASADGVNQVAVTIRPGPGGDPRLVAFVVLDNTAHLDAVGLRRHLRARVPEYMIPQHFVELHSLPLTHNRKIDYANLPQLDSQATTTEHRGIPTTASEKLLADVWCDLVGAAGVSTQDNFFEIGGHSMLTIRAIAMILRETGVELQPQFFIHEDLASIAKRLDAGIRNGHSASAQPARPNLLRGVLGRLFGPGS